MGSVLFWGVGGAESSLALSCLDWRPLPVCWSMRPICPRGRLKPGLGRLLAYIFPPVSFRFVRSCASLAFFTAFVVVWLRTRVHVSYLLEVDPGLALVPLSLSPICCLVIFRDVLVYAGEIRPVPSRKMFARWVRLFTRQESSVQRVYIQFATSA